MNLVTYGLSPSQQKLIKEKFSKWPVKNMRGILSLDNLPPKSCEILSIHTDSVISNQILKELPKLKFIVTRTTGYDHIDLSACKRAKINVANCGGLNSVSVAEFTFGLILSSIRNLPKAFEKGRTLSFDSSDLVGTELQGKTLGIVGTGSIGAHVGRIAKGFGMKLVGFDVQKNQELIKKTHIQYLNLKQVFQRADIISLHLPATPMTEGLVNNQLLSQVKNGTTLVNTARGSLVNSAAILKALDSGKFSGYAADVLEHEAWVLARPKVLTAKQRQVVAAQKSLAKHPKVLFTPHVAHATSESMDRIFARNIELILGYSKGQKIPTII